MAEGRGRLAVLERVMGKRPPDDQDEGKPAGEMRLTPRNGRIQKLVVTFG